MSYLFFQKGGLTRLNEEEEEEEKKKKTNPLTIEMRFYLISMVDPWFPISMNKAKHHNKEKPLDETKMAKLLDRFDNMLTGLTGWSKRV